MDWTSPWQERISGTRPILAGRPICWPTPAAAIEIGPERIRVTAELADAGTQSRVWPRFLSIYPGYGHYANRRDVPPRMFLLHPRGAADPDTGPLA